MNQFRVNVRLTVTLVAATILFFVYGLPYGMSLEWAAGCTFLMVSLSCVPGKGKLTREGFLMYFLGMCIIGSALVLVANPALPADAPLSLGTLVSVLSVPIFFGVTRLAEESVTDAPSDTVPTHALLLGSVPVLGFVWALSLDGAQRIREARIHRRLSKHRVAT